MLRKSHQLLSDSDIPCNPNDANGNFVPSDNVAIGLIVVPAADVSVVVAVVVVVVVVVSSAANADGGDGNGRIVDVTPAVVTAAAVVAKKP